MLYLEQRSNYMHKLTLNVNNHIFLNLNVPENNISLWMFLPVGIKAFE